MICVFINMTGTPEGSTESGFMMSNNKRYRGQKHISQVSTSP